MASPLKTPEKSGKQPSSFRTPSPQLGANSRVTRSSAKKAALLNSANKTPNTSIQTSAVNNVQVPNMPEQLAPTPPENNQFLTPVVGKKRPKQSEINLENEIHPEGEINPEDEINPDERRMLCEVYGKKWQTQEMLRKCTPAAKPTPGKRTPVEKPRKVVRDSFATTTFCNCMRAIDR